MANFIVEKIWTTEQGYQAVVIKHNSHLKHRCGYICIPKSHPAYNKPYDDISLNVHGGLTYGKLSSTYPIETETPQYWIGFDCAHYMDSEQIQTLEFCIQQGESMAQQLALLYIRTP